MATDKNIKKLYKKTYKKLRVWVIKEEKMLMRQWKRLVKLMSHCGKLVFYASAIVVVLLAITLSAIRIMLPQVVEKKSEIEKYLSNKSGYHVTVGNIATYWKGLHPGVIVSGVRVYNKDKKQILTQFQQLRVSLVLLPLLWREIEVNELILVKPKLAFERLRDGKYRIRGLSPIKKNKNKVNPGGFAKWLFGQGLLVIQDGEIIWRDYKTGEKPIRVTGLNLHLKNKRSQHSLGFTAKFPEELCRNCSLAIDIEGNPLIDRRNWRGDIYLNATGVDLSKLPKVIREKIPIKVNAYLNTEMWSKWDQGLPIEVNGRFDISKLSTVVKQLKKPITVTYISAQTQFTRSGPQMQLDLSNTQVVMKKERWQIGRLRLKYHPNRSSIRIKSIDLERLNQLLPYIKGNNKAVKVIKKIKPRGLVSNLYFELIGKLKKPDDLTLSADIENFHVLPYRKAPGVEGLSGYIKMHKNHGKFILGPESFVLDMPRYFRYPIAVDSASGFVTWQKYDDYWKIMARDLHAQGDDAAGTGIVDVKFPIDRSIAPWIKFRINVHRGVAAHARRYLPINVLPKKVVAWFDEAIKSGDITKGYVMYDGSTRKFPHTPDMGDFETAFHVRNAEFQYLPGWPRIKKADVDVKFRRASMQITATLGVTDKIQIRKLVVQSDGLGKLSNEPINVSATLIGGVNNGIIMLREGLDQYKDNTWRHLLAPGLSGNGQGLVHFLLRLNPKNFSKYYLQGHYVTRNSSMKLPVANLNASNLRGSVHFSQGGITKGLVQGQVLGGSAVLTMEVIENKYGPQVEFRGQGSFTGKGLGNAFSPWLRSFVKGNGNWEGTMYYGQNRSRLNLNADVASIALVYPPPFKKDKGFAKKFSMRTVSSNKKRQLVLVRLDRQAGGLFEFIKPYQVWQFNRGVFNIGRPGSGLPRKKGLHISAKAVYVDADAWYEIIKKQKGKGEIPEIITRITGQTDYLDMFNREYGKISVSISRKDSIWQGNVDGKNAKGKMWLSFDPAGREYRFLLSRFVLPEKKTEGKDVIDPRGLPKISLRVNSLRFQEKEYGKFNMVGWPIDNGWKFHKFDFSNKAVNLKANGEWLYKTGQHQSNINVTLDVNDLGKTLKLFDTPNFVKKGKGNFQADFNWQGPPYDINYATLGGTVSFKARRGRFLKLKPGAGRLLGALDITSITRYLILDFSPIFGKGFAFSKIGGSLAINRGKAYTDLDIRGRSADMKLTGDVNIADETYNLLLAVTPRLGGSLATLGLQLWNPATAFWIWVTQQLFKKQIDKKTRVYYKISGTWQDPVVKKIPKQGRNKKVEEVEFES